MEQHKPDGFPSSATSCFGAMLQDPPTLLSALKCSISTLYSTCLWHHQAGNLRFGSVTFSGERPRGKKELNVFRQLRLENSLHERGAAVPLLASTHATPSLSLHLTTTHVVCSVVLAPEEKWLILPPGGGVTSVTAPFQFPFSLLLVSLCGGRHSKLFLSEERRAETYPALPSKASCKVDQTGTLLPSVCNWSPFHSSLSLTAAM